LEASDLVVMDRLFLLTAGYLRFSMNWHYIIFRWIVLGSFFFRIIGDLAGTGSTLFLGGFFFEAANWVVTARL
jgi:hypothetical protein